MLGDFSSISSYVIFSASAVEVGFSQTLYSVREGNGSVEIAITKSGSNARSVDVAFTTKDNTATSKKI